MEYTTRTSAPSLQQHMVKTYMWVALGVFVSFITGIVLNISGIAAYVVYNHPFMLLGVFFGQLGLVIYLAARIMKMRPITAKVCYLLYCLSFGLFLSFITMEYALSDIILALGGASLLFVSLVAIGVTTKMDLTKLGTICFAGLLSMILYSIVAMLLGFEYSTVMYSFIGLILFMGFTAWDAQNCVRMYEAHKEDSELLVKLSIYSAFEFYLDFMNMFVRLLRIIGEK